MDLTLATRAAGPATVIEVGGDVDVFTASRLGDAINAAAESGVSDLVVDLEQVEFLDSTAIGVLVGSMKRISSAGGTMRLVCTRPRLLKIFAITGLDKVFTILDSYPPAG